jgi:hypothetical protein
MGRLAKRKFPYPRSKEVEWGPLEDDRGASLPKCARDQVVPETI